MVVSHEAFNSLDLVVVRVLTTLIQSKLLIVILNQLQVTKKTLNSGPVYYWCSQKRRSELLN